MPQMAPLNWLTLMIMFLTIMIAFNMMNYYSFHYSVKKSLMLKEKKLINWKW